MANVDPFEILAARFNLYWAAYGSTVPGLHETPTTPWTLLGTNGYQNYTTDGLVVSAPFSKEEFRSLGHGGVAKVFLNQEDVMVRVTIADMTLAQAKVAFNNNTVTENVASGGNPGYYDMGMSRGLNLTPLSIIALSTEGSPYGNLRARFVVPKCVQTSSPEMVFRRNGPALIAFEFQALIDFDEATDAKKLGYFEAQDDSIGT